MFACLRSQLLGPHLGDGTLPQPLLTNAHLHHDGHQVIEFLSTHLTDFIVTLALGSLPRHGALGLERGGLDVSQQLAFPSVAVMQPDCDGKGVIHQTVPTRIRFDRGLSCSSRSLLLLNNFSPCWCRNGCRRFVPASPI